MKRREFIAGLGSTVAWPVLVRAQQRQKSRGLVSWDWRSVSLDKSDSGFPGRVKEIRAH